MKTALTDSLLAKIGNVIYIYCCNNTWQMLLMFNFLKKSCEKHVSSFIYRIKSQELFCKKNIFDI